MVKPGQAKLHNPGTTEEGKEEINLQIIILILVNILFMYTVYVLSTKRNISFSQCFEYGEKQCKHKVGLNLPEDR